MTEESKSKGGAESAPLVNQPNRNQVADKVKHEVEEHFNMCSKAAWKLVCHGEEAERDDFGQFDKDHDNKVDTFNFGMCWPPRCVEYPNTACKYTYQGFPIFITATTIVQVKSEAGT